MRTIDADTVVTIQVYDDMTEETDTKKMTVAEAIDEWSDEGCPPTVDAVEVVRCKDCKWRDQKSGNCKRFRKGWYVQANSFCSWGEERPVYYITGDDFSVAELLGGSEQ